MKFIFQAGGALQQDHPTYVEREADQEAFQTARNGEYLHVIAPRQLGKTSLLKRLTARLNGMGWRCAYVDLSTLMDFPKPIWYAELGKELASSLTPGQKPSLTNQIDLRRYLLDTAISSLGGQPHVALLLDEVEGAGKARDTDGASFSDTFFMTLRNLYIQRDDYEGTIIVALAGAVDPNELVKDPDISPFNVGQEINLDDFSQSESYALTLHLSNLGVQIEKEVYQTIYEWTNGHPYLTQRICIELEKSVHAGALAAITSQDVDRVVNQVILNLFNPLQRDKNLRHIGKMLTGLTSQAATLWSRLQGGGIVSRKDAPDEIYLELFLTGAIKVEENRLVVRNRIYERAFTKATDPKLDPDKKKGGEVIGKAVRVFVSSTWQDLQPERKAVEEALHRMQNTTFGGMEYFGSRPETPKEVSLKEVDQSDVYIGIFAHRYGSGITEAEYRRARELGIPCLIYVKDEDVPVLPSHLEREPDKSARLDALKRELKSHHTVSFFKNPDQLATQVVADLHNLFGNAPSLRKEKLLQPGPKYQINITDSQGVVIGDQSNVTQIITSAKPTEQRYFVSRSKHQIIQVKGEHRVYLVDQDGARSWIPDGPTLESLARWEDVELLASWDELEGFPPKQPLASIVYGIKPWLVKVRGEKEIFLIDKTGIRHRIKDLDSGPSIDERTEVDVLASWKELERFRPGQPLSNIGLDKA